MCSGVRRAILPESSGRHGRPKFRWCSRNGRCGRCWRNSKARCVAWPSCFTERGCDCRSGGHAFCAPRVAEGAYALRILECARLRIKDVDFHQRILTLQETKGGNGRVTMLPDAAREALREQMKAARAFYDADRATGAPGVHLPNALAVKT